MDHRLPPPPPSPIQSAFRTTYLNAFNQIFDNSINVNCICKTTCINNNLVATTSKISNHLLSTHNNDDDDEFMDTDDDEDLPEIQKTKRPTTNVSNFLDEMEKKLIDLDLIELNDPQISKSQCDCSCFENMRCVYNVLKSCFQNSSTNLNECLLNFEQKWSNFKFIASDATRCCDYYGKLIVYFFK